MKKLSIFLLAIVAILSFSACTEDDDFTFVAKPDPEGVAFTNTFLGSYILKPSNADNLAERFVWNEADMDVQTTVRYELQASTDASFESMSILASNIAETNYAVTIAEMLSLASEAGLDTDPETEAPNAGEVFFRVRAYVGETSATNVEQFSEPVSITIELVEETNEEVELPKLYMVGNFQAASGYKNDWSPADGVPLTASEIGKTDYEGFVYLNVETPLYKFVPTQDGWEGNYGEAGDAEGAYTEALALDGPNAGTPDGTGGYYLVKADTEALTYSLEEHLWGIIGNATPTGWESDTDMTYDTEAHVWTINMDLIGGSFIKFRSNDNWDDLNVGDNDGDGTAEYGGTDIEVPEDGNYTITLDLTDSRNPQYTLTKN